MCQPTSSSPTEHVRSRLPALHVRRGYARDIHGDEFVRIPFQRPLVQNATLITLVFYLFIFAIVPLLVLFACLFFGFILVHNVVVLARRQNNDLTWHNGRLCLLGLLRMDDKKRSAKQPILCSVCACRNLCFWRTKKTTLRHAFCSNSRFSSSCPAKMILSPKLRVNKSLITRSVG